MADVIIVILTAQIHDKLNLWSHFIDSIGHWPTQLWYLRSYSLLWVLATDASLEGVGGVCFSSQVQWFVWRLSIGNMTAQRLLTGDNLGRNITINYLELVAYVSHLHIFSPFIPPLDHIVLQVDNTAADIWEFRVSVTSPTLVGPLLQ